MVEMHRAGAFQPDYFDFCLRRAAQNAFILSDCSLRAAALIGARFRRDGAAAGALAGAAAGAAAFAGRPAGRPVRLTGPCNASIARFKRSRSATKRLTICSVCINEILTPLVNQRQASNRDIFMPELGMALNETFHDRDAFLVLNHLDAHALTSQQVLRAQERPVFPYHHPWNLI